MGWYRPILRIFSLIIPFLVLNNFLFILFNFVGKEKIVFRIRFFNFIIFIPILFFILNFYEIKVVAALYVFITICISIFLLLKCPHIYRDFFVKSFYISVFLISTLVIFYFLTSISLANHSLKEFLITACAIILAIMVFDLKNNMIFVIIRRVIRWI